VLTQADLDAEFNFYGSNSIYTNPLPTPTTIWDIMINEGTTALPYEPYLPLTKFKAIPKSRNLISFPYFMVEATGSNIIERNGVVATVQKDGGVYLKGTATQETYFQLSNVRFSEQNITIYESGTMATDGNVCLSKSGNISSGIYCAFDKNNGLTFVCVITGKTVDGVVYLMLNKGDTPLPYEPPQEYWK
jgi:hypothetical protein